MARPATGDGHREWTSRAAAAGLKGVASFRLALPLALWTSRRDAEDRALMILTSPCGLPWSPRGDLAADLGEAPDQRRMNNQDRN